VEHDRPSCEHLPALGLPGLAEASLPVKARCIERGDRSKSLERQASAQAVTWAAAPRTAVWRRRPERVARGRSPGGDRPLARRDSHVGATGQGGSVDRDDLDRLCRAPARGVVVGRPSREPRRLAATHDAQARAELAQRGSVARIGQRAVVLRIGQRLRAV